MHAFRLLAFASFIVGFALHALAQVDAIARAKNNPANSRTAIIKARAIPILVRGTICVAGFSLWLQGELVTALTAIGVPIPAMVSKILDLHVGAAIAFLAGYAFDSGLAYIPFLKSSVPPSIDALGGALADAVEHTEKAQDETKKAADALGVAAAVAPTMPPLGLAHTPEDRP